MKKQTIILAMIAVTILFFALIGISISTTPTTNQKSLKLIHVITRHGIRTPADTYPNDPYKQHTFHPIGWGQLTNEGKLQMYENGKFLKERYGHFLGTHYSPDQYYTQCTDVDRTKASVQLVNAALWPPVDEQKWGPLDWQPIPVHSEPLAQDNLLLVRRPCAQYHIELANIKNSPEIIAKFDEYQHLFHNLTNITGKLVLDFDDVQDIYSTLKAEEMFNLSLPEWTKNYYPNQMYEPTIFSYVLNAYNDKLQRLKGGVFLKKILHDWKAKLNNTIEPEDAKAFLYGGHDSTIANLLSAFKVWDPQMPTYGIMILIEFSEDQITHNHGIEIFLRNSTRTPPIQLTIPNCDSFCPLEKLEELVENVIPANWDEECKSNDPNFTPPPPKGP